MCGQEFGGYAATLPVPNQVGSGTGKLHTLILPLGSGRKCLLNGCGEPSSASSLQPWISLLPHPCPSVFIGGERNPKKLGTNCPEKSDVKMKGTEERFKTDICYENRTFGHPRAEVPPPNPQLSTSSVPYPCPSVFICGERNPKRLGTNRPKKSDVRMKGLSALTTMRFK